MNRRQRLTASAAALVLVGGGFLVGNASAATQNATACRALIKTSDGVSQTEQLTYSECRFDKLDSAVKNLGATSPAPSPSATPTSSPSASETPKPSASPTVTPSPSPTPTKSTASPTPSATATSPAPSPSSSAPATTGYPDASNTGVPAGTSLTKVPAEATSGAGWTWKGNGEDCIHVETDGAVLSGLDVTGCIEVYANNATIQNSRVTAPGDGWAVGARAVSGLTVKDSTLSGGGKRMAVGVKDVTGSSDVTVLRVDVSGYSSGIQTSRGLVQDSYIHDPILQAGDHTNGFTDNGGRSDGSLTLRHNTILNKFDQADAISFFQDFGVIKNVTADNNLIAGGSYAMYAGAGGKGASSNVTITNNRFSTRYFAGSGTFGAACCYDNVASNTWSGNVWADGPKAGQPVPAP